MTAHRALGALLVLAGGLGCAAEPRTSDNPPVEPSPDAESSTPPKVDAKPASIPADAAAPAPDPETPPVTKDAAPPSAPAPDGPPPSGGEEGDEPPDRPLNVDKTNPQTFTFKFKPSEADPMASARDETQTAVFNSGAPKIQGKLVVTLSGVGGAPGPLGVATYAAGLGFHAFAVAYLNSINPSTQNDPKFFGDMRYEQFDGMDRTKAFAVARPDCVEVRVTKALAYLQAKNPQGDWGYYLKKDGTVRWSDVIFIGHSHGASSAAAYGHLKRLWRAISLSGPRDTRPVTASWFTEPSPTPIDRYYGFTGSGDAQFGDHQKAMEAGKYVGTLTDVEGAQAPFGGSHRLKYNGGHGGSADCRNYDAVCKYMLGVQ
jgi:hypothetical protein